MVSRTLVLGGDGVAGIAWALGLIDRMRQDGVELAAADSIVGTSAGSCVGAVVATGALERAVALQRRPETSEIVVPFDGEAYIGPAAGLELLEPLLNDPALERYQPLHAAHAELLSRAGGAPGALRAYERAIALTADAVERAELERRRPRALR